MNFIAFRRALPICLCVLLPVADAVAAGGAQTGGPVEAELISAADAAVPGKSLRLGLRLRHEPHWHTYWRNPGDSGLPTQLELKLPAGVQAGPLLWPMPERIGVGPLANYGFEGDTVLPFEITIAADVVAQKLPINAHATWLVCKDVCIPGEADLALELPVRAAAQPGPNASLFDAFEQRTPRGEPLIAALYPSLQAISLVLPVEADAVEFFPFAESVIQPAAAQRLFKLGEQRRLELQWSEHGRTPLTELNGVAWINHQPVAIQTRLAEGAAPAGELIGAAEVIKQSQPERRGFAAPGQSAVPGSTSSIKAAGNTPRVASPDRAVHDGSPRQAARDVPSEPAARALGAVALVAMIGSAMLGGLLLNLMPCVFPVVGLKLLGFAQDAGGDRWAAKRNALWFGFGIVVSFWALSALMLLARSAGEAIGWGFQLQSPVFVAALALLFLLIGLNLSGVFDIGQRVTQLAGSVALPGGSTKHGAWSSWLAGVLATLVATPCTAPFMGSALGLTLHQPAPLVVAVLSAVGVGMALPYWLLTQWPALARRMPKSGPWMVTLRQALAFPMYATVAWLMWVLALQQGEQAVLRFGFAAVLVALAAWLWGRVNAGIAARAGAAIAALCAAVVLWPSLAADGSAAAPGARSAVAGDPWLPWTPEAVEQERRRGRHVFVDFTAAWCISCQVNKTLVLDSAAVRAAFEKHDVALLRADWTRRDPRISAALAELGRNGVPVYVVYRAGSDAPQLLPEILSPEIVIAAFAAH